MVSPKVVQIPSKQSFLAKHSELSGHLSSCLHIPLSHISMVHGSLSSHTGKIHPLAGSQILSVVQELLSEQIKAMCWQPVGKQKSRVQALLSSQMREKVHPEEGLQLSKVQTAIIAKN
jgi:hypothetical protein